MAALSGKPLANLTKETLTKMRIDQSFDVFYPITLPARVKAWLAIQRLQEERRTSARLEVGVLTYP